MTDGKQWGWVALFLDTGGTVPYYLQYKTDIVLQKPYYLWYKPNIGVTNTYYLQHKTLISVSKTLQPKP